jgi:addiction module HigA family antidote
MRKVPYSHPGEILPEEFLRPMGITQCRLAKEIGVPQRRIGEIVAGTRAITADTGLRLSRFFGMSDGFWIGLQMDYDAARAKDSLAETLANIKLDPGRSPLESPGLTPSRHGGAIGVPSRNPLQKHLPLHLSVALWRSTMTQDYLDWNVPHY